MYYKQVLGCSSYRVIFPKDYRILNNINVTQYLLDEIYKSSKFFNFTKLYTFFHVDMDPGLEFSQILMTLMTWQWLLKTILNLSY